MSSNLFKHMPGVLASVPTVPTVPEGVPAGTASVMQTNTYGITWSIGAQTNCSASYLGKYPDGGWEADRVLSGVRTTFFTITSSLIEDSNALHDWDTLYVGVSGSGPAPSPTEVYDVSFKRNTTTFGGVNSVTAPDSIVSVSNPTPGPGSFTLEITVSTNTFVGTVDQISAIFFVGLK